MKLTGRLLGGFAVAALAFTTAATPAQAATQYPTPTPTPADCYTGMRTVNADRSVGVVSLSNSKLTWEQNASAPVPFDATYLRQTGAAGDATTFQESYFGTASDGTAKFYRSRSEKQANGTWKRYVDGAVTSMSSGWFQKSLTTAYLPSAVANTPGQDYLYRLTTAGDLYRYAVNFSGKTIGAPVKVFGGGAAINAIGAAPSTTVNGKPTAVLLATLSTGELREYLIPGATPTQWTSRTVRPASASGWQNFTTISARSCGTGQVVIGLSAHHVASYYDPNGLTANDADIHGGASTMPVLPSTTRVFAW
ncbi:hypothetical protein QFZ52_002677 [Arthrobacter woluwensis]|uniref:hypothetical protein n=1 Tax=Arthrobacter woluwensis TaxID=156980 RepID=UPI0027844E78|nr:hypothetical protein [Arthrobacter woluwensis]MDQ0710025.1 hypothetical protein [Arthrobacter woluwensis]